MLTIKSSKKEICFNSLEQIYTYDKNFWLLIFYFSK